jgi:8-oxo-dGTP diphosphatase
MTEFPAPIATVDLALFALVEGGLGLLLPRRDRDPYRGARALPGGFVHVDEDEDTADTARRVAREKLGMEAPYLEQLYTFSGRLRDPRGWSIAVAYFGLVPAEALSEAVRADLMPVDRLPALPFDHGTIAARAIQRLRDKSTYSSLPTFLLPPEFTLHELRTLYERITGEQIDKANFRRQVVDAQKLVEPTGVKRTGLAHRPAEMFRIVRPEARVMRAPIVAARRAKPAEGV